MLLVDNIDNKDFLNELLNAMVDELPAPRLDVAVDGELLVQWTRSYFAIGGIYICRYPLKLQKKMYIHYSFWISLVI